MARRPFPSLGQRIGLTLGIGVLLIIGFAIYAGLLVALVVAGPGWLVFNWVRNRRFLHQHAGQRFLVVTRRHGWGDFIVNNVEPVLPPRTQCVWDNSEERLTPLSFYFRWWARRPRGLRRPYLVVIDEKPVALRIVPMHEKLLPLKGQTKSSGEVRDAVRTTFKSALDG
jgi:hypothetical protein